MVVRGGWYDGSDTILQLDSARWNRRDGLRPGGEHSRGGMHDLPGVAGLGWHGGGGSGELLRDLHHGYELLHAGDGKHERDFRTPTEIQDHHGGGRVHDECGGDCGDPYLSDAKLNLELSAAVDQRSTDSRGRLSTLIQRTPRSHTWPSAKPMAFFIGAMKEQETHHRGNC